MSFAPFVLAALILLAAHFRDVRADKRDAALQTAHEAERAEWMYERQELLTRIQAPTLVPRPRPAAGEPEAEKPETDEWDLVGTIAAGAEA